MTAITQQQQRLRELAAPVVTGLGLEFWGLEYQSNRRPPLLRVFIESTADGAGHGVSVDDCERVSCQLSGVFDVEDPLPGRYQLEVSSPGMDRRLFEPQHFQRFVGARARLSLRVPRNGQRNFNGRILPRPEGAEPLVALRGADGARHCFACADIDSARLVPEVGKAEAGGASWS